MGQFASPNYPNTYPLNVECVWKLSASPGNKMSLFFTELDIEPSDDCNGDYLEVRERDENGPLLGDFCGNQVPTNLTEASSFWVKFRSNGAGVAKGFRAEYSYGKMRSRDASFGFLLVGILYVVLDTMSEITGTSGTITSPMYPRSYARADNIAWRITVDIGSVIAISFNRYAIDRHTDDPLMCDGALRVSDPFLRSSLSRIRSHFSFSFPSRYTTGTMRRLPPCSQAAATSNRTRSLPPRTWCTSCSITRTLWNRRRFR